jgi:SAM-dependent MidA family methyltransferase
LYSDKKLNPLNQSGLKVGSKPELEALIRRVIDEAGGWIDFATFMTHALYDPLSGYYSSKNWQIGESATSGSDFITAPQLCPAFGHTLAASIEQAMQNTHTSEVWEFGPGTGALAEQVLSNLGNRISKYHLVEVSAHLKSKQQERLSAFGDQVCWDSVLPNQIQGVVLGNEVLDAMAVNVIKRIDGIWFEQGVGYDPTQTNQSFEWISRPTELRPPVDDEFTGDYLTEVHPRAHAFVQTIVQRLTKGALILIDYGFPEKEYYHPQRHMGTLMCHWQHEADTNPLVHVGHKDITAHVNFTGVALAAQDAGGQILGYTSQGNYLLNSGFLDHLKNADAQIKSRALMLINEHEMGELFKILVIGVGAEWEPIGCSRGDRTHTL